MLSKQKRSRFFRRILFSWRVVSTAAINLKTLGIIPLGFFNDMVFNGIHLPTGTRAEAGSYFRAQIDSQPVDDILDEFSLTDSEYVLVDTVYRSNPLTLKGLSGRWRQRRVGAMRRP